MQRLRGRGLGTGMALGTAAVVRVQNGIALLPEVPPRILAEQAARRSVEPPDLILVADDYRIAQSVLPSLKWGNVVGFATGSFPPDAPVPGLPAVADLPELTARVQDDVLLLVDAERGFALLDPDAMAVSQYQAEYENIAPKRRLFLDAAHLPAETLDDKTIQVIAELAPQAIEAGADALFVSLETEEVVFSNETPTAEQRLADALSIAAGKPLFVAWEGSVAPETLLQAAAQIDLTVVVPAREDWNVVTLAVEELRAAEAVCQEREVRYASPRLAAEITYRRKEDRPDPLQDVALVESLIEQGASRLLFYSLVWDDDFLRRLEAMIAAANAALVPVYVHLGEFTPPLDTPESAVRILVGAGAAGLLTYFPMVTQVKDILRETNAAECREWLLQRLAENVGD